MRDALLIVAAISTAALVIGFAFWFLFHFGIMDAGALSQ